jgi:S-adenosylmethionine:tRNA ribosyltransferase-isomerase
VGRVTALTSLDFELPPELEATAPPEDRGLRRDDVRLLVAHRRGTTVAHHRFRDLASVLEAGDVLVVNTSATVPAALAARVRGRSATVHLSSRLPAELTVVELRRGPEGTTEPWLDADPGVEVTLPAGAQVHLLAPLPGQQRTRLWVARLEGTGDLDAYLAAHGRPIRYRYVDRPWPLDAYQTVFARHPGSAEMPSAGRPFSIELVAELVVAGVGFAPVTLHCGVSSPEAGEAPYDEWFRVPAASADTVNTARQRGRRVIAVGTTAVRALGSVCDDQGMVHPGQGWTDLVVSPERPVAAIDGLITGWHEPRASHLSLIESVAGPELLAASYRAALDERYRWHEFGDSHLVLP